MLKPAYALHKLRVKHATRWTIHREDSVAAIQCRPVRQHGLKPILRNYVTATQYGTDSCRRDACGTKESPDFTSGANKDPRLTAGASKNL